MTARGWKYHVPARKFARFTVYPVDVAEFMRRTGADEETAKSYLEAEEGDLREALVSYRFPTVRKATS